MSRRPIIPASAVISAPFIVCVLVLAAAVAGKEMLVRWAGGSMRKAPIPLRKPLETLDESKLGDYEVLEKSQMSPTIEQALGTKQYIDWVLVDQSVKSKIDPRRFLHVAVTYYTGTQDPVPHTPDACFLGAGYSPKQDHETRNVDVSRAGQVPVRVCTFIKTAIFNREEPTVVYTFHANGRFAADRESVRHTTTNLLTKHAYFSKVEISFGGPHCRPRNLGREESVAATAKLFNVLLPILIEEHWPDWKSVEQSETAAAPRGT